jgi:hypothetical protein
LKRRSTPTQNLSVVPNSIEIGGDVRNVEGIKERYAGNEKRGTVGVFLGNL